MNAEEIMKTIKELSNAERIKLLEMLFDEYFDNRPPVEAIIREKNRSFWGDDDEW